MNIYDELRRRIPVNSEEGFRHVDAYIKPASDGHYQKLYFYLMDAKNPGIDIQIGRHPYDYVLAKVPCEDENRYLSAVNEAKKIFGILSTNFLQYFAKSELIFLKYSLIYPKQEFRNTLKTLERMVKFDERLNNDAAGLRIRRVGRNNFDPEKIKEAFDILSGLR